jgi:hypothetical protein
MIRQMAADSSLYTYTYLPISLSLPYLTLFLLLSLFAYFFSLSFSDPLILLQLWRHRVTRGTACDTGGSAGEHLVVHGPRVVLTTALARRYRPCSSDCPAPRGSLEIVCYCARKGLTFLKMVPNPREREWVV